MYRLNYLLSLFYIAYLYNYFSVVCCVIGHYLINYILLLAYSKSVMLFYSTFALLNFILRYIDARKTLILVLILACNKYLIFNTNAADLSRQLKAKGSF